MSYKTRKSQGLYSTREAAQYLHVTLPTFRKYRDIAKVKPRRMRMKKDQYYSHEQLLDIIDYLAPELPEYDYHIERALVKRAKNRKEEDNDG